MERQGKRMGANLEAALELGRACRPGRQRAWVLRRRPLHALGAAGGAEEFQVLVRGRLAQHKVPDGFGTFVQRGLTVEHAGTVRVRWPGRWTCTMTGCMRNQVIMRASPMRIWLDGCGLGAQSLTKEVEDHKQTDKRRHGENDRRQNV